MRSQGIATTNKRICRSPLLERLERTLEEPSQACRLVQTGRRTFDLIPGTGERLLASAIARSAPDGRKLRGQTAKMKTKIQAWEADNSLMSVPEAKTLGYKNKNPPPKKSCVRHMQCVHLEPGVSDELGPAFFLATKLVAAVSKGDHFPECKQGRRFLILWHQAAEPIWDGAEEESASEQAAVEHAENVRDRTMSSDPIAACGYVCSGDPSFFRWEAAQYQDEGSALCEIQEIGWPNYLRKNGLAFHVGESNMKKSEEEVVALRMEPNDIPLPSGSPSEVREDVTDVVGLSCVLEHPTGFGQQFAVFSALVPAVRTAIQIAAEALEKWGDDEVWVEFGKMVESPVPLSAFNLNEQWCQITGHRQQIWMGARQEERAREEEKQTKLDDEKARRDAAKEARRQKAKEKREHIAALGLPRITRRVRPKGKRAGDGRHQTMVVFAKRRKPVIKKGKAPKRRPRRRERSKREEPVPTPEEEDDGGSADAKEQEYRELFNLVPEIDDGDDDDSDVGHGDVANPGGCEDASEQSDDEDGPTTDGDPPPGGKPPGPPSAAPPPVVRVGVAEETSEGSDNSSEEFDGAAPKAGGKRRTKTTAKRRGRKLLPPAEGKLLRPAEAHASGDPTWEPPGGIRENQAGAVAVAVARPQRPSAHVNPLAHLPDHPQVVGPPIVDALQSITLVVVDEEAVEFSWLQNGAIMRDGQELGRLSRWAGKEDWFYTIRCKCENHSWKCKQQVKRRRVNDDMHREIITHMVRWLWSGRQKTEHEHALLWKHYEKPSY
jgi:hypothetical protein